MICSDGACVTGKGAGNASVGCATSTNHPTLRSPYPCNILLDIFFRHSFGAMISALLGTFHRFLIPGKSIGGARYGVHVVAMNSLGASAGGVIHHALAQSQWDISA